MDETEERQDSSGTAERIDHYAPIFRDGRNERSVISTFGGLRRFADDNTLNLLPIIELTSAEDFEHLDSYKQAGDDVLVDAPVYLTQTEAPNGLTEDVQDLLSGTDQSELLRDYCDKVDVPVVSGDLEQPFDYTTLIPRYRDLAEEFDKIAVRIFVPTSPLTGDQEEGLRSLAQELSQDDRVLLDYIHRGHLGPSGQGRQNLMEVASTFDSNPRTVLDAFNVYKGENYNFGPDIAREIGVAGFGDYAVDRRFPDRTAPPIGKWDTRNIRHYDFYDQDVKRFEGEGFNGDDGAYQELQRWDKWDDSHCQFCEQADATTSEGMGTWKQIRMGHYIEAVIEEES